MFRAVRHDRDLAVRLREQNFGERAAQVFGHLERAPTLPTVLRLEPLRLRELRAAAVADEEDDGLQVVGDPEVAAPVRPVRHGRCRDLSLRGGGRRFGCRLLTVVGHDLGHGPLEIGLAEARTARGEDGGAKRQESEFDGDHPLRVRHGILRGDACPCETHPSLGRSRPSTREPQVVLMRIRIRVLL